MKRTKKTLILTSLTILPIVSTISISCGNTTNKIENKEIEFHTYQNKYSEIQSELKNTKFNSEFLNRIVNQFRSFLEKMKNDESNTNYLKKLEILKQKYQEFLNEVEILNKLEISKKDLKQYIDEIRGKIASNNFSNEQKNEIEIIIKEAENSLNDKNIKIEDLNNIKRKIENKNKEIEFHTYQNKYSEIQSELKNTKFNSEFLNGIVNQFRNFLEKMKNDESNTNYLKKLEILKQKYQEFLNEVEILNKLEISKKDLKQYIDEIRGKIASNNFSNEQKNEIEIIIKEAENSLNDKNIKIEDLNDIKRKIENKFNEIQSNIKPNLPNTDKKTNRLKWGHWNILKFTGKNNQLKKTKRISLLSFLEKFDILGLTEVNDDKGVKNIVDNLNSYSNSDTYSFIVSKKLKGDQFKNNSAEHVAIIYNKLKLSLEKFDNGELGHSYTKTFIDDFGNNDAQYARPPYGVKFKYNLIPNKKLTFVFCHFDGPGVKGDIGEKSYHGLGSFEYREAKQLSNVLDYFDSIDGPQSNIFFGGDTNIKLGKESFAFATMKNRYKAIFEDNNNFLTSLGKKHPWSQPYDKMFYKSEFGIENPFIFDLYKIKNDENIIKKFREHGIEVKDNEKLNTASVLSDHTYIGSEILIN